MTDYRSDFLRLLAARGQIHQCTDAAALDALTARETIIGYIGFDCTAASLHVGNLMTLMMLRRLASCGHKPLVILGGGTTQIGDPSGKDETRKLTEKKEIAENARRIKKIVKVFLKGDVVILDNAAWLKGLNYIRFLRDVGRHFSVNKMLTMDSVRLRLEREQNLSFLEFNYMILQAYDFLHLYREYGCRLQMGGSDQWGNIVNGVELARRVEGAELFGLTAPLLTSSSGAKMGKTAAGAVWLDAAMLSPYDYWQYWRNVDDADVGRFLRIFTDLSLDEIARLEALEGEEINEAKKILAGEACRMAHGSRAAEEAEKGAEAAFEGRESHDKMPSVLMAKKEMGLLELLVLADLAASNSEARRYVRAGAVKLEDRLVRDETLRLKRDDFGDRGYVKLSVGKKRHSLVRFGG